MVCHLSAFGSDDGDFARMPGIRLFTGNTSIISSAAAQAKLLILRRIRLL